MTFISKDSNSKEGQKKTKAPPSFQHLPRDRALKLKKQWVEKKKMKAKWRAQKRREGIEDRPREGSVGVDSHELESGGSDDAEGTPTDRNEESETIRPEVAPSDSRPSRRTSASKGKTPARSSQVNPKRKREEAPDSSQPSLRELTRQAYSNSKSSHYASGAGKRVQQNVHERTRFSSNPSHLAMKRVSGHGGASVKPGRGVSQARRTPRDQPNMKLRMEAMLERIKRDYS